MIKTAEIIYDPVRTEVLTPHQYVEVFAKYRNQIANVWVIPARLGENHFGKIIVSYKTPRYAWRTDTLR